MIWNPFAKEKKEQVLGIDIGTSSIKIVELERKDEGVTLSNYAQFFAKSEYMSTEAGSFHILDAQVAKIIQQIFQEAGFVTSYSFLSLPVFSSFSTLVNLPAMDESDLDEAVRYEARKFIPVPLEEVQFSWVKVDHLSDDESNKILSVAAPSEIVEKYQRIASMSNLELGNMELETFSNARSLARLDPGPLIIMDIGAGTTNVGILDGGITVMHHNIDSGGTSFTSAIAQGLAVDPMRAESFKREEGLKDSSSEVFSVLRPSVDQIIFEAEQVVDSYEREGGKRPEKAILTGGTSRMPGLAKHVENSLNISAEGGDPFQSISYPEQLKSFLGKNAPEFSVAVGLALR